jgi:hypothetical protein
MKKAKELMEIICKTYNKIKELETKLLNTKH